jgi:phosphoribosylanthranilate isomerase
MTWIKICGITNPEDAQLAVDAGANALGFVFYDKSPRKVDVETARSIVAQLPESVEKVGVFVAQSVPEILKIVPRANLTAMQIHGENLAKDLAHLSDFAKLIVALPERRFAAGFSLAVDQSVRRNMLAILLDSGSSSSPGGTGKTFDWGKNREAVAAISAILPVIVAGGLSPDNVTEAIQTLHPWGVDVASGTEARAGKKDPQKVRAFIEAVRRADKAA